MPKPGTQPAPARPRPIPQPAPLPGSKAQWPRREPAEGEALEIPAAVVASIPRSWWTGGSFLAEPEEPTGA